VSYFDVVTKTGADYVGQPLPGATDLKIRFGVVGTEWLAYYFFSPSGMSSGSHNRLGVYELATGNIGFFPLSPPDDLAGMRDGTVAVLAGGDLTFYEPGGQVVSKLAYAGKIDRIASLDSGAIAFQADGDIFCETPQHELMRVTSSTTVELLIH
jgi:hypothetical protein